MGEFIVAYSHDLSEVSDFSFCLASSTCVLLKAPKCRRCGRLPLLNN
jgi:hypothetical protein